MDRLRDNILNAIVLAVVLFACALGVHNWLKEPQIERVRVYRFAP